MHNLMSYIRKNKFKIITTIIFVICAYSIIRIANDSYEKQAQEETSKYENVERIKTDGTITLSFDSCEKVINEFLTNCVKGNYEEAYSYLSKNCKKDKYPTYESFEKNYCLAKKMKGKTYVIKRLKNEEIYKYKIEFNDMLSSGKKETQKIVDYYTIYVDNGHEIKICID